MVLVYFRALSLVTFHSSPVLRSHVVGNVGPTEYEWFTKNKKKYILMLQQTLCCLTEKVATKKLLMLQDL